MLSRDTEYKLRPLFNFNYIRLIHLYKIFSQFKLNYVDINIDIRHPEFLITRVHAPCITCIVRCHYYIYNMH